MDSRHLVDPELLDALRLFPPFTFTRDSLPAIRTRLDGMSDTLEAIQPPAPEIERREVLAPGLEGAPPVRLLVYVHKTLGEGRPAYFHIHGGGFVVGRADQSDARNRVLAQTLGCVVVSVDYRLAPETVFPGNIEDCYAGLKWLHLHAIELGADPDRIAIGGESAGGALTAALALMARDRHEVPIIHQQLIYPMLDDRRPAEPHPYAGEFGWTAEGNSFGWSCILGREPGSIGVSPYAAAARAEVLDGLPPAFIGVGSLDLLMEEDVEYARRLMRAGVPVELHIYPGAFHGSDLMTEARVSKLHARDQLEALRVAFERSAKR